MGFEVALPGCNRGSLSLEQIFDFETARQIKPCSRVGTSSGADSSVVLGYGSRLYKLRVWVIFVLWFRLVHSLFNDVKVQVRKKHLRNQLRLRFCGQELWTSAQVCFAFAFGDSASPRGWLAL